MKNVLNEELLRIREIFSHLNIEIPVISEGKLVKYLGNGFDAINPSSSVSKLLGTESTTAIENSLVNAAKMSPSVMKQLGKNIQSNITITDLKTAFGESLGSSLASKIIKQMTPEESKQLIDNVSNYILSTNLSKNLNSISSSDPLLSTFKNSVSSELTPEQAQRILNNIQLYKNAVNNLSDVKLKENWLDAIDLAEVQANTTLLKNELPPEPQNLELSVPDPQSYLNKYTKEELEKIHNSFSWKPIGSGSEVSSGWKFHVFGEDIKDAVYLTDVLTPVINKYGAHGKVGGTGQISLDAFKPGGYQYGKQGVTIYIPVNVINSNLQKQMFEDIKTAISGYKKGGTISGDKALTPAIHYRYELLGPIDYKTGISTVSPGINTRTGEPLPSDYSNMYSKNEGGPYKPEDVPDIFDLPSASIQTPPQKNINFISNVFGDDSLIDWSKITNAKNSNDYNSLIKKALDTGDVQYISRGGFEKYGISDFRQYLKEKFIDNQGLTGNPGKPVEF